MATFKEMLYGRKNTQPGNADKDQGMAEFLDAIKQYEQSGNNQYSWLEDFQGGPELGSSEMGKIQSNPQYAQFEQQALRDLEQQSKDGLSARDLADMAQLESQVNRSNSGRIGAIQQGMAARGMGGSGMELVAQMQAAQDATERQALASLEKNAQVQQGRRDATSQLGNMAGQLQGRDFQQAAQKAAAQDAINRFNTANTWNQNQMNHQGRQGIANQNVAQNNQFQQNVMGAKQGGAQMTFNKGVDANNARNASKGGGLAGMAGGALSGAAAGSTLGPWGMAGGAAIGALSGMHNGGEVPGQASIPGDHPANDTEPKMLSPGEIVLPRSITQLDPSEAGKAAKMFVDLMNMTSKKKG
jgi:hypothetical protein